VRESIRPNAFSQSPNLTNWLDGREQTCPFAVIDHFRRGNFIMAAILVVEDEAQVLILAESYLEEHGHKTLTAGSLEQALALIDSTETEGTTTCNCLCTGRSDA
jgi:PleD family two-component response regulator